MSATELTVVKNGGSVLTGLTSFASAASFLQREGGGGRTKLVAVVSAEFGHTDALAREAESVLGGRVFRPGAPETAALDLLWSTGELRSVALLTMALHKAGVAAVGLNAHETGVRADAGGEAVALNDLALRAALASNDVVVVPGFLATRRQQIVTLGRGGSDLSAVLLAASLRADRCVLIKDVDGYFTHDPATHAHAEPIPSLSYADALDMADAGCPLVQRQAIAAAERARVLVTVRSFTGTGSHITTPGVVHTQSPERLPESFFASPAFAS